MDILTKESGAGPEQSSRVATTGSVLTTLVSKYMNKEWIIDNGAINHMISQLNVLNDIH